ncbi:DNA gyrase subunit A [[Mycoplasma] cavipharyngis]|uniref:DNA topoisomerase (ATP-hydrolyzing) n=1 Tax=[Mycoplasma] cavipharyngis TaxID=92757 RepID=UPI003704C683
MNNKKTSSHNESFIHRSLDEIISEVFGRYAKYIIQDRALPDLRDGLKPVQRRILYVAHLKNLTHNKPHKKSTNLVGEVMGNFHPHGDASIYEAIVRMAQPWKSNLQLLEMHGNVGSIDGDPAAASRYTEIRLGAVSEWMLKNIEKKTVDFVNNFDDTQKEPTVLPALFFNLLINGSSGIAAGYATNIPPFNPSELCQVLLKLIDNNDLSIEQILKLLPAPDFPTKGTIEIGNGIKEAYQTGRGKFFLHANYSIEQTPKMQQIIFSDIPFETNKANIVKQIDDLIWNNQLSNVLEVRDESDQNGLSIVLDVDLKADIKTIVNYLYKNTDLRISYNINFVVIDNRKPKLMNIKQLLNAFLVHVENVVKKAFLFDVDQIKKRIEILLGLIKALSITDEIINLIRRSSNKADAKAKLEAKYCFSPNQSEAIVQLRLYRLSADDVSELKLEHQQLTQNLATIENLLNSKEQFNHHLKQLFLEFNQNFGLKRQSQLCQNWLNLEFDQEALIVDKPLYYCWTKNQELKIIDQKKVELSDLKNNKIKPNDFYRDFQTINNKDALLIFTNLGNVFILNVAKIEVKKLSSLPISINQYLKIDLDEKIVDLLVLDHQCNTDHKMVLLTTKYGLTKRILINDFIKIKNSNRSISVIKLNSNDTLVAATLIQQNLASVLFLTKNGMGTHVLLNQINCLSRNSMGQKAIKLKNDDQIISVLEVPSNKNLFLFLWFEAGIKKIAFNNKKQLNKLAQIGFSLGLNHPNLKSAFFVSDHDQIWISDHQEKISLVNLNDLLKDKKTSAISHFNDLWKETLFAEKLIYETYDQEKITKLF